MAKNNHSFFIGAAVAAGLASTLAAVFLKKNHRGFKKQATDAAHTMVDWGNFRSDNMSKNFLIGSLAGSMVGATTALLLAPKAGKDLIQEIVDVFQNNGISQISKRFLSKAVKHTVSPRAKHVQRKKTSTSKRKHKATPAHKGASHAMHS